GGEIRLVSEAGRGSTFTLYLPLAYIGPALPAPPQAVAPTPASPMPRFKVSPQPEPLKDDRDTVTAGDDVLLIVEDDPHYARVLLGLARDRGFRGIVATRGQTALALAREFKPKAVTLDVFLPDMLGWTVLNHLKLNPDTRHIPVQLLSIEEE